MKGPLLVFGAAGQVGQELLATAAARDIAAVAITRATADITNAAAVAALVDAHRPRLVVNAAAYTAVDRAESEPELAHAVNAVGPGVLAQAAARAGVPIVQLSTDYVFDGSKSGAYTEDDAISPLGAYGRSKAAGEAAVRAATPHHLILRTAWVYGRYGHNFLKTMLRLAAERDRLRVVADQRGCPTSTVDIAEAILAADAGLMRDPALAGTYHFAGSGVTTWHGFAEAIVAAQAKLSGRTPVVDAIATADYPTPARRPNNSELNSARFAERFGIRAEAWQTRTKEIVGLLASQRG